jgi:hypothetical protein
MHELFVPSSKETKMFNDANGHELHEGDTVWINPYDIVSMDTCIAYRRAHGEACADNNIPARLFDVTSDPSDNPAVMRAKIVEFRKTRRGVDVTFDVYRCESELRSLRTLATVSTLATSPHLDMFHERECAMLSGVERRVINRGDYDERARFTVSTTNEPDSDCMMFAHVNLWRGYANDVYQTFDAVDRDQTLNEEDAFMLCGWRFDMLREEGDSFGAFRRDFFNAVVDSFEGLSPNDAWTASSAVSRMAQIMFTLLSNRSTARRESELSHADANVVRAVEAYDDENEAVIDASISDWYASLPA